MDTPSMPIAWCLEDINSSNWRLRDVAHLLSSRCSFDDGNGDYVNRPTKTTTTSPPTSMPMSCHFDSDDSLERIRLEKSQIVRRSFDAAATAVLKAMVKSSNDDDDNYDEPDYSDDNEDEDESEEEQNVADNINFKIKGRQKGLPNVLNQWDEIETLRVVSMDRAHNNKEYMKTKKGTKTISNINPNVSIAGLSGTGGGGRRNAGESHKGGGSGAPGNGGTSSSGKQKGNSSSKGSNSRDPPKFTRNTPASSAAALDSRSTSSRAILCTAGNVAFEALTPSFPTNYGHEIDVVDIPQNTNRNKPGEQHNGLSSSSLETTAAVAAPTVNMGAVVVEAQTLGQRAICVAENAVRRSSHRYQYRKDNIRFGQNTKKSFFQLKNPFAWKEENSSDAEEYEPSIDAILEEMMIPYRPTEDSLTEMWTNVCLPRFMKILQTGAGHAILHDVSWFSRHGRIANLLEQLSHETEDKQQNFGPHLIVTTEPEVGRFAQEFSYVNSHMRLLSTVDTESLRALMYLGGKTQRRQLRQFFSKATGLPDSPLHVLITSYSVFLQDYIHFCQLPFEVVLLDDGVSFMACAVSDPNSPLGQIWDSSIWSTKDQQIGLAGTSYNKKKWDFSLDEISPDTLKDAWIGLTTRHRILTSSNMKVHQRNSIDLVPVSGLVNFVAPHFADVVREEWDRSRIHSDSASMEHFRKLLTRSMIVHHPDSFRDEEEEDYTIDDMHLLSLAALKGKLPTPDRSYDPEVPELIQDEAFVKDGKVAFSRRSSLVWLGSANTSWLRYELGVAQFRPILDAMNSSDTHGHFCEEMATASSTTSSGAAGQVTGTLAYRLAVRCGRHFGSEQGLRQHLSALHAPPGTWLCRTCGIDCITSQSRTHHERSCGQPSGATNADHNGCGGGGAGANSTVGKGGGSSGRQHHHGPIGVVGKKKGQRVGASQGGDSPDDKDPDGSFRVPGYRGVWVNQEGKHFVKIDGKRLSTSKKLMPAANTTTGTTTATENNSNNDTLFFDNIDEAARVHDEVVKESKDIDSKKVQLNFKPDGTRIIHEVSTPASTTGLGGSASNVVPALSVINIKDLPPDVKPLLRDPRQTSRTGGNSKRHVYAYRGVCRQARKGHDRWQSQISFMGVNHYLGTFDSEWDAAAIYAWAHLILYGEEATKKAQKEGEEAAAAYEQEKKDIAAGKIPPPPPKPEKKKKKKPTKKKVDDNDGTGAKEANNNENKETSSEMQKKRKSTNSPASGENNHKNKKTKVTPKVDKEAIAPTLAKGVTKTSVLAPRDDPFKDQSDQELIRSVAQRLDAAHQSGYCCVSDNAALLPLVMDNSIRPCLPVSSMSSIPGGAMLLGLPSSFFDWDINSFISTRPAQLLLEECLSDDDDQDDEIEQKAKSILAEEFGNNGLNETFRTLLLGTSCIIGNAGRRTIRAYESLGLGSIPLGSAVGAIDCHVGGVHKSCSEAAAFIQYSPTSVSDFQFSSISSHNDDSNNIEDFVTLNGQRITGEMGSFPLCNEDICTVGVRVFVFLTPTDK